MLAMIFFLAWLLIFLFFREGRLSRFPFVVLNHEQHVLERQMSVEVEKATNRRFESVGLRSLSKVAIPKFHSGKESSRFP